MKEKNRMRVKEKCTQREMDEGGRERRLSSSTRDVCRWRREREGWGDEEAVTMIERSV